jgi:hypothetical protein
MKIIFALLVLTSCIANQGSKYQEFALAAEKIFNCQDANLLTYNSNQIDVIEDECQLKINYEEIENFSSASYSSRWSARAFDGGISILTQSFDRLNYNCSTNFSGVSFNGLTLTDSINYLETRINNYGGGPNRVSMIGRMQYDSTNGFSYYHVVTDSTHHSLYKKVDDALFLIQQVPVTLTLSTGITYAQKLKMIGNSVQYKIWELGSVEPASYVFTTTDNSIASGELTASCYLGQGYWDNLRIYDIDSLADYETTVHTIEFDNYEFEQDLFKWSGFEATLELNVSDQIRFDVSLDGGSNYLTYDGNDWITNTNGFNDALSSSELNQFITSLTTDTTQVRLRAYLKSADGTTTPKIQQVKLLFKDRPL